MADVARSVRAHADPDPTRADMPRQQRSPAARMALSTPPWERSEVLRRSCANLARRSQVRLHNGVSDKG